MKLLSLKKMGGRVSILLEERVVLSERLLEGSTGHCVLALHRRGQKEGQEAASDFMDPIFQNCSSGTLLSPYSCQLASLHSACRGSLCLSSLGLVCLYSRG